MRLGRTNSFRRALSRRRAEEIDAEVQIAGHIAKLTAGKWSKSYGVVCNSVLLLHKDAKVRGAPRRTAVKAAHTSLTPPSRTGRHSAPSPRRSYPSVV